MNYFAESIDDVVNEFGVDLDQGLSNQSASNQLNEHGPNELSHARRRSSWRILLEQFKSVVIIIFALDGVAALLTAQWVEAAAICAVVVVNAAIGFVTEFKAVRSVEALREMVGREARVRREGKQKQVADRVARPRHHDLGWDRREDVFNQHQHDDSNETKLFKRLLDSVLHVVFLHSST